MRLQLGQRKDAVGGKEIESFEGSWVSYNAKHFRNFRLIEAADAKHGRPGKLRVKIKRGDPVMCSKQNHSTQLKVSVLQHQYLHALTTSGINVFAKVCVNESEDLTANTPTKLDAKCSSSWGDGHGESVTFDVEPSALTSIVVQIFEPAKDLNFDNATLLGQCSLPLEDIFEGEISRLEESGKSWKWEGWRVVREPSGDVAQLLPTMREKEADEFDDESADYANPLSGRTFETED